MSHVTLVSQDLDGTHTLLEIPMKTHTMIFSLFAVMATGLMLAGCASGAESDEGLRIRVGGYGDAQPVSPQMFEVNADRSDTTNVHS